MAIHSLMVTSNILQRPFSLLNLDFKVKLDYSSSCWVQKIENQYKKRLKSKLQVTKWEQLPRKEPCSINIQQSTNTRVGVDRYYHHKLYKDLEISCQWLDQ
jgi:hypothetical protein